MHEFARKIGTANETQIEDSQQETLKKLELLLITDVSFYMGLVAENLSSGSQPKGDSNQSHQLQRRARKLKSHLKQDYILYFPKSEKQRG